MNYKNSTLLLAAAAITIFNFQSCSKYEDNSGLQLRSKTGRLTGEWEVVKIDGQSFSTYAGAGYEMTFEFEKDGDFEMKQSYSSPGYSYSYSYNGEWEWEDNKEAIEVEIDGSGGYTMAFEIKKLTNDEMTLDFEMYGQEWEFEKK
jgi:hypothetical protein